MSNDYKLRDFILIISRAHERNGRSETNESNNVKANLFSSKKKNFLPKNFVSIFFIA